MEVSGDLNELASLASHTPRSMSCRSGSEDDLEEIASSSCDDVEAETVDLVAAETGPRALNFFPRPSHPTD